MIGGALLAATLVLWMVIFDFWDRYEDEIRRSWWKYLMGG